MAWRSAAKSDVEAKLAEIRAAGRPAGGEEANEFYRLPDGVADTTDLWLEAVEPFDGSTFDAEVEDLPFVGSSEDEVPPPGQPWDKLDAAEAILAKYAPSLDLMHEAAAKQGAARFPVDFNEGYLIILEHVDMLRKGTQMFQLEARVAAHRGDAAAVADSLFAIHEAGESLRFEPIMVSHLVRAAMAGVVCEELNALLPHVDFSDAQLQSLGTELADVEFHPGVHRAIIGERGIGIEVFLNPAEAGEQNSGGPNNRSESGLPGSLATLPRYDDLSFYLDFMTPMIA